MTINKFKRTAICFSLLAAFSCTDNFEEINTNPEGASTAQLEQDFNNIKSLFKPAFSRLYISDITWQYQIQQSLQADAWSGYMITPVPFGNENNYDYALNPGWNGFAWDTAYVDIIANLFKVEQRAKGKFDQFYAWSLIIKVAQMQRITDMYGPAVYSKYGADGTVTYDSQKDIYSQMFKDLDFAVAELTKRINANEASTFTGTDLSLYNGNYTQWVKYANSLRLRMAMRIVKADPALAKTEAEKAVSNSIGVFKVNADVMKVKSPVDLNVIDVMSHVWVGLAMGADMQSILEGYGDPRLAKYWNTSDQVPGEYASVRTGVTYPSGTTYAKFSQTGPRTKTGEVTWMSTAEVYFLRAEGALRGWNMGGTGKDLYEAGIKASFDQNGVEGAAAYAADNTKKAADYVDPLFPANNTPAVSKVTVAWGADNETNLEKIITQKWIATYPDGQEAWSEFRRTGYPKLFRIANNKSGGVISTELGVRRLPFAQSEAANNPKGVESGVAVLGGPDNGATRLWWDVNKANF
ncbi:RagB/SusD family nutrient uptake outer membrane protein [Flavobacterium sp. LC2016-12]|uniref:RagB/SusD family nutrient uptake outer membrane protein n=1 Tax=Flavobacterium sp. LC2016-12 TaxID=2783794 RepID=UPI00188D32AF|nr:RagB/SusD family nutrient uptake outer membrane protein [Flavobacterium sp. LC2016-12]MBF4467658.1 SusD/RagB family nutrient-binding outer membrane lipoprotein [Flavobacterium sp. LC2016-12]